MAESLGTAVLELRTDGRKFRRGIRTAEKQARRAGRNMTKFLTVPIAAIGIVAGRSAALYGDAMNKVVSLTNATREEVDELSAGILKLGPAVGKAPQELAEALFPIASAGFLGAEAMQVLTAASFASVAGMGSTENAARGVTKILANFGDELESVGEAAGIMIAATKEADAPPEAIANAFTVFLPKAKSLGIALRTVSAEFAFLTRALGSPETAASSFRQVMAKIQKPPETLTKILEGTVASMENLKKIAGEQGVTAAVKALASVIPPTSREFALFFEDVNAADAAMILLAGDANGLQDVMANLAKSGVSTLLDAFSDAKQSPMFRFRQALAAFQASMIVLGNAILPLVIPFIQKLVDVIVRAGNAFARLAPQVQTNILKIAALAAIAGPVLLVITVLMRGFSFLLLTIVSVTKNVVLAIAWMARVITATLLRLVFFFFSLPGLIATALVAVIAGILFFPRTMFTFFAGVIQNIARAFVGGFNNFVVIPFQRAVNLLLDSLPDAFKEATNIRSITVNDVVDTSFVADIGKTFEQAGDVAVKEFNTMKSAVLKVTDKMVTLLKGLLPEGLMDIFFPDGLDQTALDIQSLIDQLTGIPDALINLPDAATEVGDAFVNMGDQIASSIASATTDAIVNLRSLADFANSVLNIILSAFVQQAIGIPFGNLFAGLFKAEGGPVAGGGTHIVGERGPELFAPKRSGTIIPNNQLKSGGGGGDVTLNLQTGLPAQILAELRMVAAEVAVDTSIKTIRKAFA